MERASGSAARDRLDRDEWARFWARGSLTTFEGHFRDNYDAEILDFWRAEFARLADGAVIVDLATGNGAVPLLAARFAREQGKTFAITGVDNAVIDADRVRAARPELEQDLAAVSLAGETPLEETGLAEASADLVTSQYGFEYGDTAAGAGEAARILRPGGRLAMIVHHHESAILAQAREGLRQVALCLEEEGFVRLAQRMIKLFRGLPPGTGDGGLNWSPGALKLREELHAAGMRLQRYARQPEVRALDSGFIEFLLPTVMQLVERSRTLEPGVIEGAWTDIEREAESYRLRMADLVSAARDEAGMARIQAQLEAAGFSAVAFQPFSYKDSVLLGWSLEATRNEAAPAAV